MFRRFKRLNLTKNITKNNEEKALVVDSLKYFNYILLFTFTLSFLAIFFMQREVNAESTFNHPTTTTFATIDYPAGDSANLNTSNANRFKKTFHHYLMSDVHGNKLKIRKIDHTGGTKKAVYCIDRTTEFPGSTAMRYHFNGTLTGNSLEIPQYTVKNGKKEIIKHKITGDQLGQLRWLVDQFYIRETGSLEAKQAIKKNLFEKTAAYKLRKGGGQPTYAQIKQESEKYYNLTNDSDLESLQQWVLWDIANEKIDSTEYNKYTGGDLFYSETSQESVASERKYMGARKDIYEYLYNTAKRKNASYKNDVKTPQIEGRPKSEQVSKQESGLNTIGIINYGYRVAIPGESENKSAITKIELFNGRGQLIDPKEYKVGLYSGEKPTKADRDLARSLNLTLQDAVGEGDFFIYFEDGSKYFDENEKFTLKAKYRKIVTYPYVYIPDESYIGDGKITQSVVMLHRDEEETEQSLEVEAPKGFDLALRKSIIKVANPETGEVRTFNERLPKVDASNLKPTSKGATKAEQTARYIHPKNPIDVEHGNIITYEFNIYNEDDQDKTIKQIKDILPRNLKMVPAEKSAINKQFGWTESSGGRVLIANVPNGGVSLKGTTPSGSGSKINGNYKMQLELYVLDTAVEHEILTNIAEITGDEPKIDRDSEPENHFKSYFSSLSDEMLSKYKGADKNKEDLSDPNYFYEGQEDDDDFEKVRVVVPKTDLALKKFVDTVNGKNLDVSRAPLVDITPLKEGGFDAKYTYNDPKENKVMVRRGDIVEYTIRVYNEGEINAYASEIEDRLPSGTVFLPEHETNIKYGWKIDDTDPSKIKTNILSKESESSEGANLIKKFSPKNSTELDYKEIKVAVKVVGVEVENLKNIAEIIKQTDELGKPREDRDSTPGNHDPEEDDQDYEHLVAAEFDLALRKYITEINGKKVEVSREPIVDTTPLKDGTGTTAIYKHPKDPLPVEENDIVKYTIRVYNEGDISGYAKEVTDNLPEGLQFVVDSEINKKYGWIQDSQNDRKIRTNYLSKEEGEKAGRDNLIVAYNKNTNTLNYRDLEIETIVSLDKNINKANSENNNQKPQDNNVNSENENTAPKPEKPNNENENNSNNQNGNEGGNNGEIIIPGDTNLIIRGKNNEFKSALVDDQEFLNQVVGGDSYLKYETVDKEEKVDSKKASEDEFAKEKVELTLNEEFTKDNETNVKIPKETQKENGTNKVNAELSKEGLEIVRLEKENALRNIAEITEDEDENGKEIEDRDSDPKRKTYEKNKEGDWEDDEDFEKLKIADKKVFDLALIKLISAYEVISGEHHGREETGHTRDTNNPEPIVKVDLNQYKIEQTEIKFIYTIEITNEGNVEGYATEISDYIPYGLKFVKEDNPDWEDKGDGKITTRALEQKLLKPGESARVEVVLRWDKVTKNFGQMTNIAEISEDKNEYGIPDIDSTPNNKVPGEDDIDDATVIVSIETGMAQTFYTVIISGLSVIGISGLGIKKSMLNSKMYF